MGKAKFTFSETERRLAEIARSATDSAHRRARRAGKVLVYRNGELQLITAGCVPKLVKKMPARPRIEKGSKFEIKPA